MDSDRSSEYSFSDTSSIVESVPGRDDIVAQLQQEIEQEIAAWLKTRVDVSSLDIVAAYDELRHLDTKEKLLLPKKVHKDEWYMASMSAHAAMVIRDIKWDVIRRAFEPRRQLLRSKALELSRTRLRPLKVTDLPLDVLHIIFHDFQDDAMTQCQDWHGIVSWDDYEVTESRRRRRTVHKLRLVCRLFYELATPLLFPVLRVQLTRSSLNLIERISQSPDIAAGVRGIQVSLGYRPKEYADSIARFKGARLRVLKGFRRLCCSQLGMAPWEDSESQDFDGNSQDQRVRAKNNYKSLRNDWEEYVRIKDRGEAFVGPLTQYQDIFQKGYAEYCRLQEEQQGLLANGGFANALAAAVSQMPNVHCLNFVNQWDSEASRPRAAKALNDNEFISRLMAAPLNLQAIEQEPIEPEQELCKLECARLLWQLPIALHRTGVSVRQIRMSRIPLMPTNYSMLFAQDHDGSPAWDDLAAACERLEFFDLGMVYQYLILTTELSDENKSHLDNFIGAILSRCGKHLRILNLGFNDVFEEHYHADSFLSRLQELPRICHVNLRYLKLKDKTLNAFCRGLGDNLRGLELDEIEVQDGVWADAIDVLRNKMAATVAINLATDPQDGPCVSLNYLRGGEFGIEYTTLAARLVRTAEMYVRGILDFNPLREGHRLKDVCTCKHHVEFPCLTHEQTFGHAR